MDMKKILQALDNASTKPVEGANAMSKFLRIVSEADLNQAALPAAPKFYITQTTYDTPGAGEDFAVTDLQRGVVVKSFGSEQEARAFVAQQDPAGAAQTELHQVQSKATAPEANPDAVPQPNVISEGANPHKVSLPVQMAMQHYQEPIKKTKSSLIDKYFTEAVEEINKQKEDRRELINQYASVIAERVRLRKRTNIYEGLEGFSDDYLRKAADPNRFGRYMITVDAAQAELQRRSGQPAAPAQQAPEQPAASQPLSSRYGPGYEGSPEPYTITVSGKNYKFAGRDKSGPGTGTIVKVPAGAIGIRGLAPVNVELGNDGMFYPAPMQEQFNPNLSPNPGFKPGPGPGMQSAVAEKFNDTDSVSVDVPLLIRLMEYAREDAQSDMDLHSVAERLIELSRTGDTLTMNDYDSIVQQDQETED